MRKAYEDIEIPKKLEREVPLIFSFVTIDLLPLTRKSQRSAEELLR